MLEPGASIQNWYIGFEHPDALALMATGVPGDEGEVGAALAVTDVQAGARSVYVKPGTNASLQPRLLHELPVLLESRAHTENRYTPMGLPVVFQLKAALDEYACATVHVLEPGARIQNWYCGWGQPVALPVMVTAVPGVVDEGGEEVAVTDVQGADVSVYALPGTYASKLPRLVKVPPPLVVSSTHSDT